MKLKDRTFIFAALAILVIPLVSSEVPSRCDQDHTLSQKSKVL
jgi:hypothetical protein